MCSRLTLVSQAEARLAAKRAARAEARDIRMRELERQQKEVRNAGSDLSRGESSATVFSTKSSELSSFAAAKVLLSSQMERKLNMETVLYLPPQHLNLYSAVLQKSSLTLCPGRFVGFFSD